MTKPVKLQLDYLNKTPILSVIIPNTNSILIGRILESLQNQTIGLSQTEILVIGVDQYNLARKKKGVRFYETDNFACASDKRNLGMQKAQGDIFLFLDDDCIPAPNWLECHLRSHQQGELIVGGTITFSEHNKFQLADNISAFHDFLYTPSSYKPYLSTANLSVNRKVIEDVGIMEKCKNRAEDLEWTVRFRSLGYRLYFDPQATVFHNPSRRNFLQLWNHWVNDAPYTLRVRLRYANLLNTPNLARQRWLFLCGAPVIATWATIYTFKQWEVLKRYWYTLPLVYITKFAWCFGAFMNFPKAEIESFCQ